MAKNPTQPTGDHQKISASAPSYQQSAAADLPVCGDLDIRIARDGTWHYRGSPIDRKSMVKLFSKVVQRDEQGDYWLVTPVERGRILVDDAPFTVVECEAIGRGRNQVLRFRSNVDEWIEAGADHPIRVTENPVTGEPSPYILVRDNLEALIVRAVFYRLVERAVEHHGDGGVYLGLWSKGEFFPLGRVP
jgi:hypothetical protein